MKCKYCAAEIAEKTKICCNCGRFVGVEGNDALVKRRRMLWIAIGIISIAIIFVLTTFGGSFMQQKMTNAHLEKQVAVTSANSLGIKLEKFQEAFNANEYAQKINLSINHPEIVNGTKDTTFQAVYSEKLALNGKLAKLDHKILALQLIAIPSESKDDHLKMITAMGVIIDLFSPDVPTAERGKILQELGFNKATDLYKTDNTAIRGNVKYQFKFVDKIGFIFSVANVNYHG